MKISIEDKTYKIDLCPILEKVMNTTDRKILRSILIQEEEVVESFPRLE